MTAPTHPPVHLRPVFDDAGEPAWLARVVVAPGDAHDVAGWVARRWTMRLPEFARSRVAELPGWWIEDDHAEAARRAVGPALVCPACLAGTPCGAWEGVDLRALDMAPRLPDERVAAPPAEPEIAASEAAGVLGLVWPCTRKAARDAYRTAARGAHPDAHPGATPDETARHAARLVEVNAAYAALGVWFALAGAPAIPEGA